MPNTVDGASFAKFRENVRKLKKWFMEWKDFQFDNFPSIKCNANNAYPWIGQGSVCRIRFVIKSVVFWTSLSSSLNTIGVRLNNHFNSLNCVAFESVEKRTEFTRAQATHNNITRKMHTQLKYKMIEAKKILIRFVFQVEISVCQSHSLIVSLSLEEISQWAFVRYGNFIKPSITHFISNVM